MENKKTLILVGLLALTLTIFGVRAFLNQKTDQYLITDKEAKNIKVRWTPYVKFEDLNEIDQLLDKNIADFFDSWHCENIYLDRYKGEIVNYRINSCNDYFISIKEGYYPYVTMASEVVKSCILYPCGYLTLFEKAEESERSYLEDFNLSQRWRELPLYEIFSAGKMGMISKELVDEIIIKESGDYHIKGESVIDRTYSFSGESYEDGWSFELQLIGWADFNSDGVEDLLIWHNYNQKEARYTVSGYSIVSKISKDGEIFLVEKLGLSDIKNIVFNKLDKLTSTEELVFPENVKYLHLDNLTSAEGLVLPESVTNLYLNSLTSAEGLALPKSVKYLYLNNSLTSAEGLVLPEYLFSLNIDNLVKYFRLGIKAYHCLSFNEETIKLQEEYLETARESGALVSLHYLDITIEDNIDNLSIEEVVEKNEKRGCSYSYPHEEIFLDGIRGIRASNKFCPPGGDTYAAHIVYLPINSKIYTFSAAVSVALPYSKESWEKCEKQLDGEFEEMISNFRIIR